MDKTAEIHNYLKTHHGTLQMWIGISDEDVEGKFKFVDGSPVTTFFWRKSTGYRHTEFLH